MPALTPTKLKFFKTPVEFRKWLDKNHARISEQWIGFYKVSSGHPSITYHEALDEALCYGWIDGLRKGVDDLSYAVRFTPRKPNSVWSMVNVRRVGELTKLGRMMPPGITAFQARDEEKSKRYSYENHRRALGEAYDKKFRANEKAWEFFQAQAPWYRRTSSWWVISAKRDKTKLRRLEQLIQCSARGERIPQLISKRNLDYVSRG